MPYRKFMPFLLKFIFLFLCTWSTIPEVKTSGSVAEVQALAVDLASMTSGMGVVTRIRNMSEFPADIGFEKILHDQIPNNTTGRIKRADGMYLTCRKDKDQPTIIFEKIDAKDPATLWTFNRIKDELLHDWIGIWHANSNGSYLGVDATTGNLIFAGKDFRTDTKAVHWEIVGTSLSGFLFKNRLTGGMLYQRTAEIEVLKEGAVDREEIVTEKAAWCISVGEPVNAGGWLGKGDYGTYAWMERKISLVDMRGGTFVMHPHDWQPIQRTEDLANGNSFLQPIKRGDGNYNGPIENNWWVHFWQDTRAWQPTAPTFVQKNLTVHVNKDSNGKHGVQVCGSWGNWECFLLSNRERFNKNTTINFGNLIAIKSWHDTWLYTDYADTKVPYKAQDKEDPSTSYFYIIPTAQNIGAFRNVQQMASDGSLKPIPGFVEQLAVRNDNDVYSVNYLRQLFHWDGSSWSSEPTSFKPRSVSVSAGGDLCCTDIDNKLWVKQDDGWKLLVSNVQNASIRSKKEIKEIWFINTDGIVSRHNGVSSEDFPLPSVKASWISVADNGAVWAIAKDDQTIWRLTDQKTKEWRQIPGNAYRISARSETEAWIVGKDGNVHCFENGRFVKKVDKASDIAVASGVSTKKILGARDKKVSTFLTTFGPDNKKYAGALEAQLTVDIEKLGMGGGIEPRSSVDFSGIPASQSPRVSGFAIDRLEDFDPAAILNVNPMISKGAAWLETSLKTPGVGGVSFMTRVRDAGDAQIILGQEMSNNFAYKVILGGWNNTKSAIVKREYINGEAVDTVVYELTIDQYPTARVQSGAFLPYWVSINNGFIMAGSGDVGANVFMAWRDPNPVQGITRIGFGSHRTPVQYNNIKITPAAVFSTVPRVYAQSLKKISPSGSNITWTDKPFRMNDRGSIQCSIQGTSGAAVILARKQNSKAPHYAIVFGDDNNSAITLKKWHTGQKKYNERARIKLDPLPAFKLDAKNKKRKTYWVSFYFGQIVIGSGDIGENPIFIFQDLAAIDGIDSVGFASHAKTSPAFSSTQIGSPLVLHATQQETSYDKTGGPIPFGGGLTIILPFDYRFSQEEQVVKMTDLVLNQSFYLGATPQQGAIYKFQVTIQPNGAPTLDWTTAPENQAQLLIQKAVQKVKNEAELASVEASQARVQGALARELKEAEAEKSRSMARSIAEGGSQIAMIGTRLAGSAAGAGPLASAVAGVGMGLTGAGAAMTIASTVVSALAANKDFEGAELELVKKRQAAEMEANASKNTALALGAANLAIVGERSHDSYVFLDKPGKRPDMGTQDTSTAAKENRAAASAKLEEAIKIRPTTIDDMIKLSLLYKDFVLLANQSAVLSGDQTVKQKFLSGADTLLQAYLDAVEKDPSMGFPLHQDMLLFLLNAYNNPYLMDELNPDEAMLKESWYWKVTIFARQYIKSTDQHAISLDHFYGEYAWLDDADDGGFKFTQPGAGLISFEARGTDIFVCLAEEKTRIRNSEVEVYEACIGGWDNTKTALRLKSLDRYVAVVTKKENPKAMADPAAFKKYWISCNNGLINIGCGKPGQGTVLTWQDPYPNTKVKVIGLSSWNSRVDFRNIVVSDAPGDIAAAEKEAATVDESATLAQNIATLQQIADAFNAAEEAENQGEKPPYSIEELDKLEVKAIDTAMAAFNQRDDGTLEDKEAFLAAIDSLNDDSSDPDHTEALDIMFDQLTAELAEAKKATPDDADAATIAVME